MQVMKSSIVEVHKVIILEPIVIAYRGVYIVIVSVFFDPDERLAVEGERSSPSTDLENDVLSLSPRPSGRAERSDARLRRAGPR